ncbi:hypothetical protein IW261DRAFT_1424281 [Armillaria novae-zelandiae]|uniref:Uncharacterized protein n=1 Tax=Armillaria novae-zelandiae TaxID=153914 RepID=A0AA39U7M3_9AGAR|nr:hypothetical protein IW261DRAFT_1424281 [Armillaria novae-zelandiae]
MFADDLESPFRGVFSKAKFAEKLVKDHQRLPETLQDSNQEAPPKTPEPEARDVRKRAIVREWPRDPKGPIMKSTPPGEVADNNQPLWGATVLDFFRTSQIGELGHAKDEIAWAEDEAEQVLFPCDMARLLRDEDHRPDSVRKLFDEKFQIEGGRISARRYLKYQNHLPPHSLPENLIVHDPDHTLHVHTGSHRPVEDRSTHRIYKLHLTQETRDAIIQEQAKLAAAAESKPGKGCIYATMSEDIRTGKVKESSVIEATFVEFPPAPPPPLSTPEAHLYINYCDRLACVEQSLFKKLREEEPDANIDETQPLIYQIEDLMMAITAKHGRQGKMWIEERSRPGEELEIVDGTRGTQEVVVAEGGCDSRTFYEGTTRRVPIDVNWTTPGNFCEHEEMYNQVPTTFKVSVGAKLSLKDDGHLEREAKNYQQFPEHFFQHWSRYNVIAPLHDPTPALAVVPQFYGYYIPEEDEAKTCNDDNMEYISTILLLEDCGGPVDVDQLDLDDPCRVLCQRSSSRLEADCFSTQNFR